ncbi:MAG: biopolymer transporter ExbD [Methylococcus sp.]|nr:MAG: biopolymer transporter ExbD [Methylococcus sp.]
MNFRPRHREEPDLNLIPMIDVLIVLLIFLLLTTTFSREAQLHISLPDAPGMAGETGNSPAGLQIVINAQGQYRINQQELADARLETVKQALKGAAGDNPDPLIIIDADRLATHQSVITVLDAAGQLGYRQVSFAAENRTSE